MKKLSLLTFLACIVACVQVRAQVIMTQDFDSPVSPALPTGWTQNSSSSPGWQTGTFAPGLWAGGAPTPPTHSSQVCFVYDASGIVNNLFDTLKSPVFSLAGATVPWLNFEDYYFKWNGEKAYVLGSNNGGTTWTVMDSISSVGGYAGAFNGQHVNLSSLGTGTNNRVAFTYSDAGNNAMYLYLENVQVVNASSRDAAVTDIDYNSKTHGISANGELVSFTIQNRGVAITSVTAYYSINGGTPIVQTFSGLSMAYYDAQKLTFAAPVSGVYAGYSNTLRVGILSVNGLSNAEPVDTAQSVSFTGASAAVQRHGLIEEFTSATSAPAYPWDRNYDSLVIPMHPDTAGGNFNLIRYQVNWPSPGNDRSYNADAQNRITYYNVTGNPLHWVNGVKSVATYSVPFTAADATTYTNEINGAAANKAFIDITATYTIDTVNHKLNVITQVTPHFTKTGTYRVCAALLDKYYQNTTNTTGQLNYYRVMRKMLPTAAGHAVTSWTDGVVQTFYDTAIAYTNGNWTLGSASYPLTNSNTFWANPLLNSALVVFINEDGGKTVMQSQAVAPALACIPPAAATITGSGTVCAGGSITLSASATGGSWSSSSPGTAAVGTMGIVAGMAGGTANITYTMSNTCGSASSVQVVTVNTAPAVSPISGSSTVCQGSSTILTESVSGGSWSSSSGTTATVGTSGTVTGVAAGTVNISYTKSNSCGTTSTYMVMTVNPLPLAGTLSGPASVCQGSTVTLTSSVGGGTWLSSGTGVATIGTSGVVSGVAAGTTTISYTVTNGCGSASSVYTVAVLTVPAAAVITGASTVCQGATVVLSASATGGTWSTSLAPVATVTAGMVAGVAAGTANISYTLTNACGSAPAIHAMTVDPLPATPSLVGASTVCQGSTITITASVPGGAWSSSAPGFASVSGGVVTGLVGATATISYVMSNSCGTNMATQVVTVQATPAAVTISGPSSVCQGSVITLTGAGAAGTWSSSVTGIATVSGSGVVSGVAMGTVNITYDASNSCGTSLDVKVVTVNPLPNAGLIAGPDTMCLGASITLSETVAGGTWNVTSGHTTITAAGILTGISTGLENVAYSTSNGCGTAIAHRFIYVRDCNTQGVNDVSAGGAIVFHPNPVRDILTISSPDEISNVVVFNVVGQQVFTGAYKSKDVEIDMSTLADGMYLIKVNDRTISKVVKQ